MSQEDDAASSVEDERDHGDEFSGDEDASRSTAQDASSEQTESLVDVNSGSSEEEDLIKLLKESYLDTGFSSKWKVAKLQTVVQEPHIPAYEEKRQNLVERGRKPEELTDEFAFFVENNIAGVELLSTIGIQTKDSEYNALGYNRMGVYLCKHADVCLQHALVKYSGTPVVRMIICKYFPGRATTAIPRVASAAEFIEPTQGFECHTSVIPPSRRDSLQNQFDRSQIYLYEINKLLQPGARPRHTMPYAVAHFTEDGTYTPLIDAEATPAEKIADNPRLQQIVKAINSKDEGGGSEPTPGVAPLGHVGGGPPTSRTSTPMPGTIPVITGGQIGGGRISMSPNAMPNPRHLTNHVNMPLTLPKHPMLVTGPRPTLFPPGFIDHTLLATNPQLRHAVSQLTAKLEAEERLKKAVGSDLIATQSKTPGLSGLRAPQLPPGMGLRIPGMRPTMPVGALPGGIPMHGAALSQTFNGALPMQQLPNPAVNNHAALNMGVLSPGSTALMGHSQIHTPGTSMAQNGLHVPVSATLPPGFALPGASAIPKAAVTPPGLPGAGILGSMPPAGLNRTSPLVSIPASRSLTPDIQAASFLPANGTSSIAQAMIGAGTSVVMSSTPLTAVPQAQQFTPMYSIAGMYGSGLIPNHSGISLEPHMALPKEAMKYDYPGAAAAAVMGAKEPKLPGVFYQTLQPAPAYGQTMVPVLNQSLKRPLDVAHAVDKRIKYY